MKIYSLRVSLFQCFKDSILIKMIWIFFIIKRIRLKNKIVFLINIILSRNEISNAYPLREGGWVWLIHAPIPST